MNILFIVIFALLLFFLPCLIAGLRKNEELFYTVFALNLLGGWTGFLWAFALALAIFGKEPAKRSKLFYINQ